MLQSREQTGRQRRKGGNPSWRKGVSGNPEGARLTIERHAALLRDLTHDLERDLGAVLTVTDRVLIERAAHLLLARPRSHNDRVRAANTADRIIQRVRERHNARRSPEDALLIGGL
jgi:hypothetical protein